MDNNQKIPSMEDIKKAMESRPEWKEYKYRLIRRAIISGVMQLGGMVLAGYYSHWGVSVGLFLIVWARNFRRVAPPKPPVEGAEDEKRS